MQGCHPGPGRGRAFNGRPAGNRALPQRILCSSVGGMKIEQLDHLVLTVRDVEVTCAFYARVLGMVPVTFGAGRRALAFGGQKINLHPAAAPISPHADHPTPGSADLCFLAAGPIEGVLAHLKKEGIDVLEPLRRQRRRAGRPYRGRRQNPGHIGQVECRDLGAQVAVVAITGVEQHHPARQTGRAGPAQLIKRNLRLGFECDVRGHMRLAPARRIGRPLRPADKAATPPAGSHDDWRATGHRHLAIVLLAELTAILTRHADRMPALLGKAGVVDDPRLDRPLLARSPADTISRTLASTRSSDQPPSPTKCSSDWCCAAVRAGAVTAAIGSTLLRSPGSISPVQ